MAFVFDDQAVIDRYERWQAAGIAVNPVSSLRYWWRGARAATLMSNLITLRLAGLTPWVWHVQNALFHALNAALVFYLFGFWPAALFFAHPITGGLSVYVSIRADLLMTRYALLSAVFLCWGGSWLLCSVLALWMARSAKACGVIAALGLWLTAWCFSGRM